MGWLGGCIIDELFGVREQFSAPSLLGAARDEVLKMGSIHAEKDQQYDDKTIGERIQLYETE